MQTVLTLIERLARDRSLRFAIGLVAAAGYVCFVIAGHVGTFDDLAALALAPTLVLWRRRPVIALAIGGAVLGAAVLRGAADISDLRDIAPFTVLVAPILGASLDERPPVRAGGLALAAAALLAAVLWAGAGPIGAADALVLPTAVLLAVPIAVGAVWRRVELRTPVLGFLRARLPDRLDTGTGFRTAVGVAGMLWLLCVVVEVGSGDPAIVLTALPVAAALPFAFSRPDLSLGLTALGLLGIAFATLFTGMFGPGDALAMLMGAAAVFGAALHGTPLQRRLAMGLVAATAIVAVGLGHGSGGGDLFLAFVVVVIGGVLPFGAAFAWRQRRAAGGLQARLTESRARERASSRDVLLEQERNRLARDVHDVVAHSLAVVIAQADGARYAAQADPATVGPALEAIADTARDALGEVRTMLHDLRTSGDGAGAPGSADLPALLDGLRALGVDVREAVFGEPRPLEPAADLAAYRIVQEALTNALRHGRRDEAIDLELDWGDREIVVVVSNTVPDRPREASERAGHGIEGMRERARLAGGECLAGLGSNGVFRVRASLPLLPAAGPEAAPAEPADEETDVLAFLAAGPAHA